MPILSFPSNPSLNQTYTFGGKIWKWNGTVWLVVRTTAEGGESAYQIAVRNGFVGTEAEWLAQIGGDVESLYTWLAYADNVTGTANFSLTFDGHSFMGLALNKNSSTPSNNPSDYNWVALGADSVIQGFLTNESHTVSANSAGVVSTFDGAGGTFQVYQGTTEITGSATFAVVSETGVDVSINSAGVYTVHSMSADSATAKLRASYNGMNIDRIYSITKAIAGNGSDAPTLSITASSQAFTFTDGVANPSSQTLTLTAAGANLSGAITWTVTPSIPTTISGTDGEIISVEVADFGTRTQVAFTAVHEATGLTDRVTLFRLNQSSAAPGATQNQQFSTPYDPGVVTKPSAGSGLSAGFDSDAYSTPSIAGDFVFKFTPLENAGGGIIVALDDFPNATDPGSSPTDQSFVMGLTSLDIYSAGLQVGTSTYAEGDKLEIRRVGATWSWWKNGTQVHSATGATGAVGIRITLQAVGSVVSGLQLLQGGISKAVVLTSRGSVTATSLPAENARNEYQGSVKVLINGAWAIYATRNVHTGPWAAGTTYAIGDFFTFSGTTYMVTTPHLATGIEPDLTKVEVFSEQGPAGDGGLSGFLTNESHIVTAASDGSVASFAGSGGTFKVFYGGDEVTSGTAFAVVSETGVDVSINPTTGVYTVSSMSADTGTAVFSAQLEDGPLIQKTYSIAKSRMGADGSSAKLIYVTSDRQTITYDSAGALSPSSQTTTFTATVQNSSATVNWTLKTITGTLLDPSIYLSQTTGLSVNLTAALFNTARGASEGVIVTATIIDSGTYADSISVVRVKQGATGTPGQDGFTGVLTNESHTVATDPAGAGGDYTVAGGTFKVFKGLVDFTTGQGVTYSLQSATGVSISINSTTGVYTITGMSADQGTAVLRANYAGTIVDKTYTIVKARAGVDGTSPKLVVLTSNRQTIAYDNADTLLAGQDIVLSVSKQNTTASVTWSLKELDGTALSAATYLSSTSGDSITMTAANFDAAIIAAATQGVIITATLTDGGTHTDSVSVIKVRDGIDGQASLTGYLTNESHVLAAETDGTVTDFSQAVGFFKLFHGTDDVTDEGAYSIISETGVDVSINTTTGAYSVASMTSDIGSATFEATWSGVTINKTFTIVKSRAGVDGSSPKLIVVHSNSQTVAYDSAGAPNPSGQTITFNTTKQNTTATVNWTVKDLSGTNRTPTTTYLSAATGDTVTMTEAQFASARNGTGGVIVTATITDGITIADSVSVVRVASGATGTAGADGIVGYLTNESHTVGANAAGVVSSFTGSGGVFKVFEGSTDMTSNVAVTYSVVSETGVDVSIDSAGNYSVASMSAGTGTAIFRALYKGINIDKVYTISKAIAGADGTNAKILVISSDRQTITYDGTGTANPTTQTTTFTAQKQNTTATVNWTLKRTDGTVLTPGTYLSATTGDSVTLTASNFDLARATTAGVMVTGTLTDGATLTDTISVMKVQSGADGTGSKSGYLTNESHIVPTAGDGSSPDFTGAGGTFKVFNGLTDVTTEATFDIPGGGAVNCTASIDTNTGVYSVTAMSATLATVTLRAQHGPTTITKVFSLVKSRAGADGAAAKVMGVSSTHQTFSYTGIGGVRTQTTTITAARQGTTQPTNWKVYSLDGTLRLGVGAAAITGYFTDAGDTLTLTHTNFNNFMTAFSTTGMTVEAYFTDGSTYSDRISIIKISDGATGTAGADSKLFAIYSNRQTISYNGNGALSPSTQDIVLTSVKQNTTATVTWSVTDADGTARTPTTTYLSAATGDTVTMTAAQFESARASTPGVIISATLTDGSVFTDKISVTQVRAGANAVTGFLTNEAATVPADGNGNVSGGSLATITGSFKLYQGTTDVSTGNSITYSVNSQTGMTAAINATTGAYTVSALSASVGRVTFAASLPAGLGGGTIFKDLTVAKATAGAPAVAGYLTNDSVSLTTNSLGSVTDFSAANGNFIIMQGGVVLSNPDVTWSKVSQTGCTATINTTTGAYSVSAMSADQAVVTFRAVTSASYGSAIIDKNLTLSKARQGSQGPAIIITPSAVGFTVQDGVLTPSTQTINLTGTLSGIAGPIAWSTTPNVASGSGTSFSITHTQFNVNTNSQVIVTASVPSGETQSIALHRLERFSSAYLTSIDATVTDTAWAKNELADMDDHSKIGRGEKKTLERIIQAIEQEYPQIVAKASTLGITTQLTTYQTKYDNLVNKYLAPYNATTNPTGTSLRDESVKTSIVKATFNAKFNEYYTAQSDLITAMHVKAASTADWTSVGGRPAELTDGRLGAGLNSDGSIKVNIPTGILTGSNVLRRTGGGLFSGALNATRGATMGVDTFDADGATILGASHLKNASITIDGSGNLVGIGTSGIQVNNANQLWSQVSGTGRPSDNATVNNVTYSSTAPGSPSNGDIWVDTSTTPQRTRIRVSGAWQIASNYTTGTSQLTDDAGLGQTAVWSTVSGAGKPADFATRNTLSRSSSAPGSPADGDIWVDTSVTPNVTKVRIAGAWQIAGNYTTGTSHLTDDAGLGLTASWSAVSSRPAELTDGRVGAALNSSGDLVRAIPQTTLDGSNVLRRAGGGLFAGALNATKNETTYSASAPGSPDNGDIWVDTSATPYVTKVRIAGVWQAAGNYVTSTSHITDGAGLGSTAVWSNVTGAGRPADGATANNVTYSASAPGTPVNGDIWVDTSVTPNQTKVRVGGVWQVAGNYTTNTNQLTDGAGLGTTAAWSGVSGIPYDKVLNNDDSTTLGFNGSFEQWTGAYPDGWNVWSTSAGFSKETSIVRYGTNAVKIVATGSDVGMMAASSWASSPMPAGTVLAGNIDFYLSAYTSGKPVLLVRMFTNSALSTYVDHHVVPPATTTGTWQTVPWVGRIGSGQQMYGLHIYVMGSWSAGVSGPFTGTVIFDRLNFAFLNGGLDNQQISIAANGTLTGGGGGSVTISGLGYTGALNATYGADWSTNVAGRPGHLTDGRISTALDASGNLISAIPTTTLNSSHVLRYTGGGAFTGALNATYGADLASNVTNNNMDNLANGATYGRIRNTQLSSGNHKLTVAGSGTRVADQRNLPAMTAMNLNYKWSGAISYTSTTTTATINVAASTVYIGSVSVAYNAMSVGVAGTSGTTRTYFLYLDDTTYAGGTKTLVATQTGNDIYLSDDRVYVGTVDVYFPTSGGSTGGGGGGGGGCVSADSWVETQTGFKLARDINEGDMLRVLTDDGESTRWEPCIQSRTKPQALFRIVSESGVVLECSDNTPITLRDGSCIAVWQVRGHDLPVYTDKLTWEPCWAEPIGMGEVQHISCSQNVYAAGMVQGESILTHNNVAKP